MNKFFTKLKEQAEENPMAALTAFGIALAGGVKTVDVVSKVQERNAYAKNARTRAKRAKK